MFDLFKQVHQKEKTFSVLLPALFFLGLKKLTIPELVSFFIKITRLNSLLSGKIDISAHLKDAYVLAPLVFSILTLFISPNIRIGLVYFGMYRLFEILVVTICILLFDDYLPRVKYDNKSSPLISYRRSVILVFINYIEIIFWFAISYKRFSLNHHLYTNFEYIKESFAIMTKFSERLPLLLTQTGDSFVFTQSVVGILMLVFVLVSFIRLLPHRKTKSPYEQNNF